MYRRWEMESYHVLIGMSWNCSASGTIVNCCNRSFMAINSYWMIVKMCANALLPQSDCSVWDLTCTGTFWGRERGCCSVIGARGRWWRARTVLFQPAAVWAESCLTCSPEVFQIWSWLVSCRVKFMAHLIAHQILGEEWEALSVAGQPWFSGAVTYGSGSSAKVHLNENANVLWREDFFSKFFSDNWKLPFPPNSNNLGKQ